MLGGIKVQSRVSESLELSVGSGFASTGLWRWTGRQRDHAISPRMRPSGLLTHVMWR